MDQPRAPEDAASSIWDRVIGTVRRSIGRGRLPFAGGSVPKLTMPPAGTAAGINTEELSRRPSSQEPVHVTCIDYAPENVELQEVTDIQAFMAAHRPDWSQVRWINIDGLTRMEIIRAFAEKYQLHPLAVEDVLHTVQRPKVEDYPAEGDQLSRLFIVARMIELHDERLRSDQMSFFLGRNTLITFQEFRGDALDPIRKRIQTRGSRLRQHDVSFLLYALLDAIVDSYFPLLEGFSDRLEDVEERLLTNPAGDVLQEVHTTKRELLLLRRAVWPLRELIAQLQRDKHECLSETTQTYFRDVYDHCVQIIDLVETYREIADDLTETYLSSISHRTNEIVKVLTIMGTIFIPLTFLAGVYGMNMPIPENRWAGSYFVFWTFCVVIACSMLVWFRRHGWL